MQIQHVPKTENTWEFSVEFNSSDMVEFSQFECLSSPAAAKLAKQIVMSTKLRRANKWLSRALKKSKKHFLERALAWAFDLAGTDTHPKRRCDSD